MSADRTRRWLALLLLISFGLRVWLACLGGQGYWADEARYVDSRTAVYDLRHGDWRGADQELLGHADHTLFRWFGLVPALGESILGSNHGALVASYFGLFSVLAIYLIWAIARRMEAGEAEALWAAYLAACANSLFYYSRHFFPYDIALCAMLAAFWFGVGPGSWRNSLLAGLAAGLGFLTYNGSWMLGGCILVLHVLLGAGGARRLVSRAVWAGLGLIGPILLLVGLAAGLGYNLVAEEEKWGALAAGDLHFGHRVIAGYLWNAEGGLLVLWLLALAYALARAGRAGRRRWLAWPIGGLGFLMGGQLLFSDVLPKFAVLGREVRGLVPFLCLGAAIGLGQFVGSRRAGRAWTIALALAAGGCAAWNFSGPIRQVFPDEFREMAAAAVARPPALRAYRLMFAQNLWGLPLDEVPSGAPSLLRRPHPLQFRPYQYEGYDTAQRAELDRHDISMRLIAWPSSVPAADSRWRGYPGPLRFLLRLPRDVPGFSEPLVASGCPGRGDVFYLRYVDSRHVAFGLDHWGTAVPLSPPIEVDYARPHEVILVAGFLVPSESPGGAPDRALFLEQGRLAVWLDGRLVYSAAVPFYPAAPSSLSFGVSFIGGTIPPSFSGDILEFGPAPASSLAAALPVLAAEESADRLARRRPADWRGCLGPLRLRLLLPPEAGASAQPLLSVGDVAAGELIFLRREGRDRVRIGFQEHEAGKTLPALLSEPLALDPSAPQSIMLSLGSMLPADDGVVYGSDAHLAALRDLLYVGVNGRVALRARRTFLPALGQVAVGADLTGGLPEISYFQGEVTSVETLGAAEIPGVPRLSEVVPVEDGGFGGYPGPIRLKVVFPPAARGQDPLLAAGVTGLADFLYVRYLDERHIQVGFDHWGGAGRVSEPIPIQPGAEQDLVLNLGFLLPPPSDPIYRGNPDLARLRPILWVALNGRTILDAPLEFHDATPDQTFIGSNPLGGSTAGPSFRGRIVSGARVPPAQIIDALAPGH